ncbi:MAG: thioredoxin family protein [Candidatus Kapabacteria bacterium]|nr:thioredoxin family protein [Candidatus Kapabacteria bacterium]
MKNILATLVLCCSLMSAAFAGGLKVGDAAVDFNLKATDGKMVSLASLGNVKGAIVIFTCNHCPYSVAYEDRIIDLHKKFGSQGFPVVAINPNDAGVVPEDSYEKMVERAAAKKFPFAYIHDNTQDIAKQYGATRTPHVFLLEKKDGKFVVRYIGAIDDNTEDGEKATMKYVESAVAALTTGKMPNPDFTKAVGCSIKWSKK